MTLLRKGAQGAAVIELQDLLIQRGYPTTRSGMFDARTYQAVRAFQAQNMDQHGQPLVVDGKVGELTWWSLNHAKPSIATPTAIDYLKLPSTDKGGGPLARAALAAAIEELRSGAGEVGGNNAGPWVKKYLTPAGVPEGNFWCASFVSWCYLQACGGDQASMPFPYSPGARSMLQKLKARGYAQPPNGGYSPQAGDIVVWWRVQLSGWQGHVGLVHQVQDGMLYTIEGNRSSKVQGFSYVLSRMDKLLGYGHIPS